MALTRFLIDFNKDIRFCLDTVPDQAERLLGRPQYPLWLAAKYVFFRLSQIQNFWNKGIFLRKLE